MALLDSRVTGPVNVASEKAVELRKMIALVAEAAARPDLLRLGALPRRPDDADVLVADARRLREEVGFEPAVTLAAGVSQSVDWWSRQRPA